MKLERIHLLVGLAVFAYFLGTGIYMRSNFPDLYHGDEAMHYIFRSRHVYILLSALLNILTGVYFSWQNDPRRKRLQTLGSLLLLIAPLLHIAAFSIEPYDMSRLGVLTTLAVSSNLIGTAAHLLGGLRIR